MAESIKLKGETNYNRKLERKRKVLLYDIVNKKLPAVSLIEEMHYSNKKIEKLDIHLTTFENLYIDDYFLVLNDVLPEDFSKILVNKKSKLKGGMFSRTKYPVDNAACNELFKKYKVGIYDRTPEGIGHRLIEIADSWNKLSKQTHNSSYVGSDMEKMTRHIKAHYFGI